MNRVVSKIKSSFRVIKLGDGIFNKLKIIKFISCLYFFGKKKKGIGRQDFNVVINGKMVNLYLSGIHPELLMINEIFNNREYDVHDNNIDIKKVIDLGGNIGLAMIYFATKYPNAEIISIEPNPTTFGYLKKNSEQFSNVKVINAAVSNLERQISFFTHPVRHLASSIYKRTEEDEEIKVSTITLDSIIGENVDVLKFDIEGAEFDVFRNFNNWSKIGYITGETHDDLIDESKYYDLVGVLKDNFNLTFVGNPKKGRKVFYGSRK